ADLVLQRSQALQCAAGASGRMVVAGTSRSRAEQLVDAVGGDRVAIAAENSASEIVLSGTTGGIEALVALARQQSIAARPLKACWPLHCSAAMRRAAVEFATRVQRHRAMPLHTPVFSPILERYYSGVEDYADCLSRHLTSPIAFASAVETLRNDGLRTFLPIG